MERFSKAEKACRKMGLRTCNPLRMRLCVWLALHGHYKLCLWLELTWMVLTCDAIYMMEDWHTSRGATVEKAMACAFDITIMFETKKTRNQENKKNYGKRSENKLRHQN